MVANEYTPEVFGPLVERVFSIDSVTVTGAKEGVLARYTGRLRGADSIAAYDALADSLRPYQVTPLFREDSGQQMIDLVAGLPDTRTGSPTLNVILLALTLLSVLLTGALYGYEGPEPVGLAGWLQTLAGSLLNGWPFAVSMLGILLAHEFGHYFVGRAHGAPVSLPYFIPFPLSAFGTMGAVISMKSPPKNRRALLDLGIAGPLAGLVVAIPVLLLGLALSTVDTLPSAVAAGQGLQLEGNSLLYLLLKWITFGRLLPEPTAYGELGPVLHWVRYFFTGRPLPLGGQDVLLHPVAWAGWAGLLVTSLNLIPAGQLDGGHILYTLLGKTWARRLYPLLVLALAGLGFIWSGWWLWAGLLLLVGRSYAEPLDQITRLDPRRKALAVLMLVVFVLVFIPVPLIILGA